MNRQPGARREYPFPATPSGNEPLFMVGAPAHLLSNKNSKSGATGCRIQYPAVLRPIYYMKPGPSTPCAGHRFVIPVAFSSLPGKRLSSNAFPAIGLYAAFSAL